MAPTPAPAAPIAPVAPITEQAAPAPAPGPPIAATEAPAATQTSDAGTAKTATMAPTPAPAAPIAPVAPVTELTEEDADRLRELLQTMSQRMNNKDDIIKDASIATAAKKTIAFFNSDIMSADHRHSLKQALLQHVPGGSSETWRKIFKDGNNSSDIQQHLVALRAWKAVTNCDMLSGQLVTFCNNEGCEIQQAFLVLRVYDLDEATMQMLMDALKLSDIGNVSDLKNSHEFISKMFQVMSKIYGYG
jgi:hypothetical protein